jgi:hypothetical protein
VSGLELGQHVVSLVRLVSSRRCLLLLEYACAVSLGLLIDNFLPEVVLNVVVSKRLCVSSLDYLIYR